MKINPEPNEVRGPCPSIKTNGIVLRPRVRQPVLARSAPGGQCLQTIPGRFIGKCSPVHFFWGAPDLAVTRFSGRPAPPHPGGVPHLPDSVAREAYSHEVSSCGFWPGGGPIPHAAFYSYAYPEPAGFAEAAVKPSAGFYSHDLREFILPYDAVRQADRPTRRC